MSESTCPECGRDLEPGLATGLCADCLLKGGLGQSDEDAYAATYDSENPAVGHGAQGPTIEELSQRLPNLEVLELLGRGGMGAVYKAKQTSLDRVVALKVINPEILSNQNLVDRFSREAKALARLNHPHIVSVYDFGNIDGMCYLVMEYVDGTDLRRLLANKDVTPEHALQVVPQICEALQFAHDQGIVHRDIKPENILIDKRGKIKIADFGLAKLLTETEAQDNLTTTRQVMGTLKYMAPEQMEGAALIDHRADIYSLGVVFYELLTGEVPLGRFAAPSAKAEVDQRIDEIVMRALERNLPDRYQQASDLQVAVQDVSSSEIPVQEQPHYAAYQDAAVDSVVDASVVDASVVEPVDTSAKAEATRNQIRAHVKILAGINIFFGALFFIIGVVVFFLLAGIGAASNEAEAMGVLSTVGGVAALIMFVLGIPSLVTGLGMWKFAPWSRYAALILAALNVFNFPLGTGLAIYTGWALLQDESPAVFGEKKSNATT